jgi:hypothetical protein
MGRNQNDENTIISASDIFQIGAKGFTSNASGNVTISNVAPSGVGTATISKWIRLLDNNGTVLYIPCWT